MLRGPDCTVHFPEHARASAERILDVFPHQKALAGEWLGIESGEARIHLVEGLAELRALVEAAPEWAVGVARGPDLIVLRLDRLGRTPATSLDLVLRHEVVHHVLAGLGASLPRWFEEGLCVHRAGVAYLEADASLERIAAAGRLPRFAEVDDWFRRDEHSAALAYRFGHAAVTEFLERFGADRLRGLLRGLRGGLAFEGAFLEATGESLEAFEERWRAALTPRVPLWLFLILENIELALLCAGALLVALGYLRWRLRRERALREADAA